MKEQTAMAAVCLPNRICCFFDEPFEGSMRVKSR